AAPVAGVRTTPNPLPVYTGTVNGVPYDVALAVGDDFLNSVMAASMQGGYLDQTVAGTFTTGTGSVAATAGSLATLLPGIGFEKFDPNAAATLVVHPTVAPFFRMTNTGGTGLLEMDVADLVVDLAVEVETGYSVTVARVAFSGQIAVNAVFNTSAGT